MKISFSVYDVNEIYVFGLNFARFSVYLHIEAHIEKEPKTIIMIIVCCYDYCYCYYIFVCNTYNIFCIYMFESL